MSAPLRERTFDCERHLTRTCSRREDVDPAALSIECDHAVGKRKKCIVLASADVSAWEVTRAALAHNDSAGPNALAAVYLDAQSFAVRFAPVADGTLSLLMSH